MIRNGITYYIKKVAKETRVSYDRPKMELQKPDVQCESGRNVVVKSDGEKGGCARFSAGRCSLDGSVCPMVEDLEMMSLEAFYRYRREIE
jgi:hypothetical protein